MSDFDSRQSLSGSYSIVATYMSGWLVTGHIATSSSLVISTSATPGFGNVSSPA